MIALILNRNPPHSLFLGLYELFFPVIFLVLRGRVLKWYEDRLPQGTLRNLRRLSRLILAAFLLILFILICVCGWSNDYVLWMLFTALLFTIADDIYVFLKIQRTEGKGVG